MFDFKRLLSAIIFSIFILSILIVFLKNFVFNIGLCYVIRLKNLSPRFIFLFLSTFLIFKDMLFFLKEIFSE